MISKDVLKKKEKSSAYIQSDVERFLASGGSIERIEGMDTSGDSRDRIRKARQEQKAVAKAKYRRLRLIASAHKRLING